MIRNRNRNGNGTAVQECEGMQGSKTILQLHCAVVAWPNDQAFIIIIIIIIIIISSSSSSIIITHSSQLYFYAGPNNTSNNLTADGPTENNVRSTKQTGPGQSRKNTLASKHKSVLAHRLLVKSSNTLERDISARVYLQ